MNRNIKSKYLRPAENTQKEKQQQKYKKEEYQRFIYDKKRNTNSKDNARQLLLKQLSKENSFLKEEVEFLRRNIKKKMNESENLMQLLHGEDENDQHEIEAILAGTIHDFITDNDVTSCDSSDVKDFSETCAFTRTSQSNKMTKQFFGKRDGIRNKKGVPRVLSLQEEQISFNKIKRTRSLTTERDERTKEIYHRKVLDVTIRLQNSCVTTLNDGGGVTDNQELFSLNQAVIDNLEGRKVDIYGVLIQIKWLPLIYDLGCV